MPRPGLRVSSLRKIKKKIPGGASIIFYFKKKPSPAKCGDCGKPLHGVKSERPSKMKGKKSQKRVSRPYGGNLCSACSRKRLKAKVRGDKE